MTCGDLREQLSACVDAELSLEEMHDVDVHLATCASCRARASSMRALKHAIARLPSREPPPGAVHARIDALRFERPRRGHLTRALAAVALVVAVAATALHFAGGGARADRLSADQLVADHLRSVTEPVEIASRDPEEIARFFANRVSFRPVVPRLGGSALKGGRLCMLAGHPSELLFYDLNGETVSLFVGDRGLAAPGCDSSRGHQVCERRVGDVSLMLVGTQPSDRLERMLAEAR